MSNTFLSKSDYLCGIQCPKMLWLMKNKPEKICPSNTRNLQLFQRGFEVGALACELFPNGKQIPYKDTPVKERIALTRQYIDEGAENIYEATFEYEGVMVMVDILHRTADNTLEIYELKSSTDLKDVYLHDTTLQYYILTQNGLNLSDAYVVYINKYYNRIDELDIQNYFIKQGVTKTVKERLHEIPEELKKLKSMLIKDIPDIPLGPYCSKPYECRAKNYCWSHIPDYSIFNISHLSGVQKFELYEQGIIKQSDITDTTELTAKQRREVVTNLDKTVHVEKFELISYLNKITYPLYYLDFESFQQAIPQFPHSRPYMQIAFQYSLHIEQSDGSLEHREFMAPEGKDPRHALATRLVHDIPDDVMVIAYNMTFEKMIIRSLVRIFPEYKDHLLSIVHNMTDLLIPFQKRMVYHYEQMGSNSIKNVLPAWVPNMKEAYNNLKGAHNGSEAMSAYSSLTSIDSKEERGIIKEGLLRYCELDTLAMVKILHKLKWLVSP